MQFFLILLVLSTLALVGAAYVCYRHIRRHWQATHAHRAVGMGQEEGADPQKLRIQNRET